MKKFYSLIFVFLVSLFVVGCGSDGGSGFSDGNTSNLTKTKGYLLDSALEGVSYFCDGKEGLTDSQGLFECANPPVTFKIGSLVLGKLEAFTTDGKVYPQDLLGLPRTNFTDSRLKLLARLLQSLDDDGDISTTIKIEQSVKDAFDVEQKFKDFNETDIKALLDGLGKNFVNEIDALNHLRESLGFDATKPVITLNGASSIELTKGTAYTELGATATDDRDGSIDVVITGTVEVTKLGTYTITYTATDKAGNSTVKTRTIKIIPLPIVPDTTKPVITLNGASSIELTKGTAYTELGATATDDRDGTVSVTISGNVDVNVVNSYTITYTAKDSAGNEATVTRTIKVILNTSISKTHQKTFT